MINSSDIPELDTIVDFSSVDTSPSFSVCDSIIEKQQKTECFRNTIHLSISEQLRSHTFEIENPIDEEIQVFITIDNEGKPRLSQVEASSNTLVQLKNLDSLLQKAMLKLPKMYPAIKRGIPVETQYNLPLRIKLN